MQNKGEIPWYWEGTYLFEKMDDQARHAVLGKSHRQIFRKGATIFRADDPANQVFFLEKGLVRIFNLSAQGSETVFWLCIDGEIFGAGGISGCARQSVFGQALDHSVIHSLKREDFEDMIHRYPQLGINVITLMGARLRLACDAVIEKTASTTDIRLARGLLRLSRNFGSWDGEEIIFRKQFTHQELGYMVGASRQTINRALNAFARRQLIRFEKRTLVIRNVDALASMTTTVE
ncbi:Crp/Fnr family transcriptional regulator [Thauera sinica]|uniref:Crp/Fnr family transcriptional regulator n=1 Tax=Thauera sinica TaxID=2665146 RepID=A0ABW1ANX6_9RHOO|nr:Crp/Fnr family transcriptional regulator [Thauera sp. K11]